MKTCVITVYGLVQGIGYRPFVAELAEKMNITGQVKNKGGIVEITATAEEKAMDQLIHRLHLSYPTGGRIDEIEVEDISYKAFDTFCIVSSEASEESVRLLPADLSICETCARELEDETNRRFRHPFISCTSCGPRYSIESRVPYDRETLTMWEFPMCEACATEYTEKQNRRRHAQTICCKDCGPEVTLYRKGQPCGSGEAAIQEAIEALKKGEIGAIKDIGGFHFAFSPFSEESAQRLRQFKHREEKPFAVMFSDLETIKEYCFVGAKEEALLTSTVKPIVLLEKKKDFAESVLKNSSRIGAMLPCNPLQILLLQELKMLVMTSGNRGGEPILLHTEEMCQLSEEGSVDFVLSHNRKILAPLDDSIYQVTTLSEEEEMVQIIRRARGLVPDPIYLKQKLKQEVFAAGGDLKAVFGYGKGRLAYLSQYFGDLEEYACFKARNKEILRMKELFAFSPKVTVGDLHPAYISAKKMQHQVQHHQAHVLSVAAEHGITEAFLGIAYDGTGAGTDGTVWGSEFLLCQGQDMKKVGSLLPLTVLGGDEGAKNGLHTLFFVFLEAKKQGLLSEAEFETFVDAYMEKQESRLLEQGVSFGVSTIQTSSMGRFFDAVAALLEVCNYNQYEGQCPIRLEEAARQGKTETIEKNMPKISLEKQENVCYGNGIKYIIELWKKMQGMSKEAGAWVFHKAVAEYTVEMAAYLAEKYEVNTIALSGGTFCNRILCKDVILGLRAKGLQVFWNEKVPCGDGGLALGQIYYEMLER